MSYKKITIAILLIGSLLLLQCGKRSASIDIKGIITSEADIIFYAKDIDVLKSYLMGSKAFNEFLNSYFFYDAMDRLGIAPLISNIKSITRLLEGDSKDIFDMFIRDFMIEYIDGNVILAFNINKKKNIKAVVLSQLRDKIYSLNNRFYLTLNEELLIGSTYKPYIESIVKTGKIFEDSKRDRDNIALLGDGATEDIIMYMKPGLLSYLLSDTNSSLIVMHNLKEKAGSIEIIPPIRSNNKHALTIQSKDYIVFISDVSFSPINIYQKIKNRKKRDFIRGIIASSGLKDSDVKNIFQDGISIYLKGIKANVNDNNTMLYPIIAVVFNVNNQSAKSRIGVFMTIINGLTGISSWEFKNIDGTKIYRHGSGYINIAITESNLIFATDFSIIKDIKALKQTNSYAIYKLNFKNLASTIMDYARRYITKSSKYTTKDYNQIKSLFKLVEAFGVLDIFATTKKDKTLFKYKFD